MLGNRANSNNGDMRPTWSSSHGHRLVVYDIHATCMFRHVSTAYMNILGRSPPGLSKHRALFSVPTSVCILTFSFLGISLEPYTHTYTHTCIEGCFWLSIASIEYLGEIISESYHRSFVPHVPMIQLIYTMNDILVRINIIALMQIFDKLCYN